MSANLRFPAGSVVTLNGLQRKPEWNGYVAEIVRWDNSRGKYLVRVQPQHEGAIDAYVQPRNLVHFQHPNGSIVTIHGLDSQPHWTGREAQVVKYLPEDRRYHVKLSLPSTHKIVSIKPRNLIRGKHQLGQQQFVHSELCSFPPRYVNPETLAPWDRVQDGSLFQAFMARIPMETRLKWGLKDSDDARFDVNAYNGYKQWMRNEPAACQWLCTAAYLLECWEEGCRRVVIDANVEECSFVIALELPLQGEVHKAFLQDHNASPSKAQPLIVVRAYFVEAPDIADFLCDWAFDMALDTKVHAESAAEMEYAKKSLRACAAALNSQRTKRARLPHNFGSRIETHVTFLSPIHGLHCRSSFVGYLEQVLESDLTPCAATVMRLSLLGAHKLSQHEYVEAFNCYSAALRLVHSSKVTVSDADIADLSVGHSKAKRAMKAQTTGDADGQTECHAPDTEHERARAYRLRDQANRYFTCGKYQQAADLFDELLKDQEGKGNIDIVLSMLCAAAAAHKELGHLDIAVEMYAKAERMHEAIGLTPLAAWLGRGAVLRLTGRLEQARTLLEKGLRFALQSGEMESGMASKFLGNLARVYTSQRQYSKALSCLEEELSLIPAQDRLMRAMTRTNMAEALYRLDRLDEAMDVVGMSLEAKRAIAPNSMLVVTSLEFLGTYI
mgnify:FL=1